MTNRTRGSSRRTRFPEVFAAAALSITTAGAALATQDGRRPDFPIKGSEPVEVALPAAAETSLENALVADAVISTPSSRGPSTNVEPYVLPSSPAVRIRSLLTVGDRPATNGYAPAGIPDGLGIRYTNTPGQFAMWSNHELGANAGAVRAHGQRGAFVSKWIVDTNTLEVKSGEDAIKQVNYWQYDSGRYASTPSGSFLAAIGRLCAATLATAAHLEYTDGSDYYGTSQSIFLTGEETGTEGREFAVLEDGTAWQLPRTGLFSWENAPIAPAKSRATVVMGSSDSTPGYLRMYVGQKMESGNPVERAGLTNGDLFVMVAGGLADDDAFRTQVGKNNPRAVTFTKVDWNKTGVLQNADAKTAGALALTRVEDGAFDPSNPNDFYFVTTEKLTPARSPAGGLWRLRYADRDKPALGATLTLVLDGSEDRDAAVAGVQGWQKPDNMDIDRNGNILIQEDPGNVAYVAGMFAYQISTGKVAKLAQFDPALVTPGAAGFLTQDEESSGVTDASDVLGLGWFILNAQVPTQSGLPADVVEYAVERGQYMAMRVDWTQVYSTTVAIIGDAPYGPDQDVSSPALPMLINHINADPLVSSVVHLGDIKNGSTVCSDGYFSWVRRAFDTFLDPLVYTPGDNEWTDCHRASNGSYIPTERLAKIRSTFFPTPGRTLGQNAVSVVSQPNFVENVRWSANGVVLTAVHIVGSNNNNAPWFGTAETAAQKALREAEVTARTDAGIAWIKAAFAEAKTTNAPGVVLAMQADMWDPTVPNADLAGYKSVIETIASESALFGKPVLLFEGDSHIFTVDQPLTAGSPRHGVTTSASNVTRIVVQGQQTGEWLKLVIDPSSPSVFSWARVKVA